MSNVCECGCGLRAKPNKRFRKYHNLSADGRALRWIGHKYEYNYRLVMEMKIGRKLRPGECVHHKNHNRNDDAPGNLELRRSNSEHITLDHSPHWKTVVCVVCGTEHRNRDSLKYPTCSRACRSKWTPPGAPRTTGAGTIRQLTCSHCGKRFRGKRKSDSGFCSHVCYAMSMKGIPAQLKSNSHVVRFHGKLVSVAELARLTGQPYKTVHTRISLGWTVEEIATTPVRDRGR